MRLRWTVIAMAILVLGSTFLVAHRRARAEQVRLALLQAEATESAPQSSGEGGAVAAGPSTAAPAGISFSATPPATGAAAVLAAPSVTAVEVAPAPVIVGAGSAPPAAGGPAHQTFFYAPVPSPYGVLQSGDDPETNELTGQDQQLEQEVQSLARQLAETDDDKQRTDLKDKLASTLEKQFDTQQKLRQLEISRIEARVQKLRDLVRKRTDSRRKIIENRLDQLLNDADGLGWNSNKGSGFQSVPYGIPATAPRPVAPRAVPLTVPGPARS